MCVCLACLWLHILNLYRTALGFDDGQRAGSVFCFPQDLSTRTVRFGLDIPTKAPEPPLKLFDLRRTYKFFRRDWICCIQVIGRTVCPIVVWWGFRYPFLGIPFSSRPKPKASPLFMENLMWVHLINDDIPIVSTVRVVIPLKCSIVNVLPGSVCFKFYIIRV